MHVRWYMDLQATTLGCNGRRRSCRLPAAAACASCRLRVATSWLAGNVHGRAGAAAIGAVGRIRCPDRAPTSESREGRKESLSSVGCRMRARLGKVFHHLTLKIKMRDQMRYWLELPLLLADSRHWQTNLGEATRSCWASSSRYQ